MRKVDWLAAGVSLREGGAALVNGHLSRCCIGCKSSSQWEASANGGRNLSNPQTNRKPGNIDQNIKLILFRVSCKKYINIFKKASEKFNNLPLLI
jgi:hypothetical protein